MESNPSQEMKNNGNVLDKLNQIEMAVEAEGQKCGIVIFFSSVFTTTMASIKIYIS